MKCLLEFLIISLKTLDGNRDSAKKYLLSSNNIKYNPKTGMNLVERFLFGESKSLLDKRENEVVSDDAEYCDEQKLYLKVIRKFTILKVRMKISFMALQKVVPVSELLLESILNTYQMYCMLGKKMKQFQRIDP